MLHSYTSFSTWDQCPAKFKYQYIDRLPQGPTPAFFKHGRDEHKAVETVLETRQPTAWYESKPDAIKQIVDRIIRSDDYMIERRIEVDREWNVAPREPWAVMKIDVAFAEDEKFVHIVDWKTGKGNPAKYHPQGTCYAAAAGVAFPGRIVVVHFANMDTGVVAPPGTYTTDGTEKLRLMWSQNFGLVEQARAADDFPAVRNPFCGNCPYGKSKGGPCEHG
jgi:hypothetical protein